MGVDAMCECVDLVRDGKAQKIPQDDSKATYESWCRQADAQIDWSKPVDEVYNLIRGTNPQPGACTPFTANELQIFDTRQVAGEVAPGPVLPVEVSTFTLSALRGSIRFARDSPPHAQQIITAD